MRLFLQSFTEAALRLLAAIEHFPSLEGPLKLFGTMRLIGEIFIDKNLRKFFHTILDFLRFSVYRFPSITSGFFGPVGLMRILSIIVEKNYGFSAQCDFSKKYILVEKDPLHFLKNAFCDMSSWGKSGFESYGYPSGVFGTVNLMKFAKNSVPLHSYKTLLRLNSERGAD